MSPAKLLQYRALEKRFGSRTLRLNCVGFSGFTHTRTECTTNLSDGVAFFKMNWLQNHPGSGFFHYLLVIAFVQRQNVGNVKFFSPVQGVFLKRGKVVFVQN